MSHCFLSVLSRDYILWLPETWNFLLIITIFSRLSSHVSTAKSTVATYPLPFISTTYDVETSRDCVREFFLLYIDVWERCWILWVIKAAAPTSLIGERSHHRNITNSFDGRITLPSKYSHLKADVVLCNLKVLIVNNTTSTMPNRTETEHSDNRPVALPSKYSHLRAVV